MGLFVMSGFNAYAAPHLFAPLRAAPELWACPVIH